jgi:hypothetical protein
MIFLPYRVDGRSCGLTTLIDFLLCISLPIMSAVPPVQVLILEFRRRKVSLARPQIFTYVVGCPCRPPRAPLLLAAFARAPVLRKS